MTQAGGWRKPRRAGGSCNMTTISSMFLLDGTRVFDAESPPSSPESCAVATPERGTPCSICRDGLCSVSTRNATPAAIGCAPTRRLRGPRTTAAIAARRFITSRHRWARGFACARVHWEAIVRISGRADRIADFAARFGHSGDRFVQKREERPLGGRPLGVRGTEVVLMFRRGLRAGCQGASPAWAVAGVPKTRISRRTHDHSCFSRRRRPMGVWSHTPSTFVPRF
jgi:hypothetical protein